MNVLTKKSSRLSITLICGLTKYTIFQGSPKFHFRWKDYFMRKNKRVSQKCKQNISCISQSYLRIENASCNQMMCGCIIHLSRKGFSMHKIFQAGSFVSRIKDLSIRISYKKIQFYGNYFIFKSSASKKEPFEFSFWFSVMHIKWNAKALLPCTFYMALQNTKEQSFAANLYHILR